MIDHNVALLDVMLFSTYLLTRTGTSRSTILPIGANIQATFSNSLLTAVLWIAFACKSVRSEFGIQGACQLSNKTCHRQNRHVDDCEFDSAGHYISKKNLHEYHVRHVPGIYGDVLEMQLDVMLHLQSTSRASQCCQLPQQACDPVS